MNIDRARKVLKAAGQPAYRARQILQAVYVDGVRSYREITSLPAALREELASKAPIMSVQQRRVVVSKDKRAHKALLKLSDDKVIESVLLKPKPGDIWTTCISTQVGCAMGCTFCATGLMGLLRDLTAEEITDQVLFWKQYLRTNKLKGRIGNVVYMGMGEPLHALKPVFESLRILTDPERFAISSRHISVSTVGIVPGIEQFVAEFPQVNLALSLHAANDTLRRKLVPMNKAYPLEKLVEVLKYALTVTKRKIFLEYVLLAGENDGKDQAQDLIRFIHKVGRPDLLHVNLIVWNPTETEHKAPLGDRARLFRDWLKRRGVRVTIRKNLGTDIDGACGQLIAE
jgi:23S rRNA (adenine2503-C2)-methyltransferase